MKNREVILASKSPRRKELLEDTDIAFHVSSEEIEETIHRELGLEQAIERIACEKAEAVARKYPEAIVIGADTMVCFDGVMLGKPKDAKDAYAMLSKLSGRHHEVITGVALLMNDRKVVFHEVTSVYFYELSDEMIHAYIATGEPMDKAGAYGIQGKGKLFVKSIEGDYFNVVGLPIARLYREIKKLQKL